MCCCEAGATRLTPRELKSRITHREPITGPLLYQVMRIQGSVVVELEIAPSGDVACLRVLQGHPILIASVVDSVRKWNFAPVTVKGKKQTTCGSLIVNLGMGTKGLQVKILDALPPENTKSAGQRP